MKIQKLIFSLLFLPIPLAGEASFEADVGSPFREEARPAFEDAPDMVERRIHAALRHLLLNRKREIELDERFFLDLDENLEKAGEKRTGLSDNIRDLRVCLEEDRAAYIRGLRSISRLRPDPELRSLISYRLQSEEINQARNLLSEDTYNRIAYAYNTVARSSSLLAVGFLAAAVDSATSLILNVTRLWRVTPRERKALVLYETHLRKNPDGPKAEELRAKARKMSERKRGEDAVSEAKRGERAFREGRFREARRRFGYALELRPGYRAAEKGRERAEREILMAEKGRQRSLTLSRRGPLPPTEEAFSDYRDILYAVCLETPAELITEAEDYLRKHGEDDFSDEALTAIAVAHEFSGAHDRAKKLFSDVHRSAPRSNMGLRSAAWLKDPRYNRLAALRKAKENYAKRKAGYILFGEDFLKTNIMLGKTGMIARGASAFQRLGVFNILGMGVRTVSSALQDPVSNRFVIDRGSEYLRRYPHSRNAEEIGALLAAAYERRGELGKAISLRQNTEGGEEKVARLKERMASSYLAAAEKEEKEEKRLEYLSSVARLFPESPSAAKALQEIETAERMGPKEFRAEKDLLLNNPEIWNREGLSLKMELLDGEEGNGEIATEGVALTKEGRLLINFDEEGRVRQETYTLPLKRAERFRTLLREARHRERVRRFREVGLDGFKENPIGGLLPIEIRGSVGSSGIHAYPRLKIKPYRSKDLHLYNP